MAVRMMLSAMVTAMLALAGPLAAAPAEAADVYSTIVARIKSGDIRANFAMLRCRKGSAPSSPVSSSICLRVPKTGSSVTRFWAPAPGSPTPRSSTCR